MAEDEKKERAIIFREILVAVDTSAHSEAALEAAVTLAKITEAHLNGLFVEEEHWNRVGQLPSVSTINALTGQSETVEKERLQRRVEQLAKRLERQLESISRRNEIRHTWNAVRGRVAEEILKAAKDADLITIGRRGRSFIQKSKLGSTTREIIRKADKPVLILKEGLRLGHTITVVYNGTPQSQNGLRMALNIARENEGELSVLVTDGSKSEGAGRDKSVEKMVENSPVPVTIHLLRQTSVGRFLNIINYEQSGLLIIPKNQSFLQGKALEITIEHIQCAVLLVS
jgi:nucleotide-binding universal stress UspA family protein